MASFVSRAGQKLEHALQHFGVEVVGHICADLGSNTGGFVDCLLQRMERHNAMHVQLPEPVSRITIDVAWTKQKNILPAARRMLLDDGLIITLIKPHYEADPKLLRRGVLPPEELDAVIAHVVQDIRACGLQVKQTASSPITGSKGNAEILALLLATDD